MNTHWRSRDAYKAAYMNMFALTDLQRLIAERLTEKLGTGVKVGRYVDIADSFHIYASYFREFAGFLRSVQERTFAERTWHSDFAQPMFQDTRRRVAQEKE